MSISENELATLGSGLAKWLGKRYLGDLSESLASELIDFEKDETKTFPT